MHILVFIAMYIVKPALIMATIISVIVAAYIITTTKGTKPMNTQHTTRSVRKLIKAVGKTKTVELLQTKGLRLEDFGIM
tara:strand:+ start:148 stop:384 length:237 start_codon:yes stop_codon:yes gene_type:complete